MAKTDWQKLSSKNSETKNSTARGESQTHNVSFPENHANTKKLYSKMSPNKKKY